MPFTLSRRTEVRKILHTSKRRKCTTVNSHINSYEYKNSNISNIDNAIGNSNITYINVPNDSTLNTLIPMQKDTNTDSSASVND